MTPGLASEVEHRPFFRQTKIFVFCYILTFVLDFDDRHIRCWSCLFFHDFFLIESNLYFHRMTSSWISIRCGYVHPKGSQFHNEQPCSRSFSSFDRLRYIGKINKNFIYKINDDSVQLTRKVGTSGKEHPSYWIMTEAA